MKIKLDKHVLDRFKKPVPDIKKEAAAPLRVGQKVVAAGVGSLGKEAKESRLKGVAKAVGGIAFSVGATMALKALIPIVFAAAAPGAAAIGVPIVLAGMSAYSILSSAKKIREKLNLHKKAFKEQGVSGRKALLMAIKENKFEVGAFVGSMIMLGIGLKGEYGHISNALAGHASEIEGAAKTATSLSSKFLQASVLIDAGGEVAGTVAEHIIKREHAVRPDAPTAKQSKFITEPAGKKSSPQEKTANHPSKPSAPAHKASPHKTTTAKRSATLPKLG